MAGTRKDGWGDAGQVALFARGLLGVLFLMTGWFKVFEMGALEHARLLFVQGYAESWIPAWLLWGLGTLIPFVELLGCLLLVVAYGHLLKEPFFDITTHVFPRAILLLIVLAIPRAADVWSVDGWLTRRRRVG